MTLESQVADLAVQTTALLNAVNVQKSFLDNAVIASSASAGLATTNGAIQVALAETQAAAALANANNAAASNTSVATLVAGTTSAAAQAANARDQAIAASQVATAANEALAALSQSLHYGNVVKLFPYFPFNDSDGGAWTDKCSDKSWETEALCPGTWRQQRANLAAAWAITGAIAGDYYQSTLDGKFYMIGGTVGAQTQTEVFRGGRRKFPRGGVAILAESWRVIIYDTSAPGCPMWMTFVWIGGVYSGGGIVINDTGTSAVSAINASIFFGDANTFDGGLRSINFISEKATTQQGSPSFCGVYRGNLAQRNSPRGYTLGTGANIINKVVNDIAVTVLDNAPVDPATGMKVPTIAVATAGGVSVIKDDGNVVNDTSLVSGSGPSSTSIIYNSAGKIIRNWGDSHRLGIAKAQYPVSSSDYNLYSSSAGGLPAPQMLLGGNGSKFSGAAVSSVLGINQIKENPADRTKTMFAAITATYPTGWQVGDQRLTTLCDTTAETITTSGELVTNGTFDTDTAGWNPVGSGGVTFVANNGTMVITKSGDVAGRPVTQFTTVVGKSYIISMDLVGTSPGVKIAAAPETVLYATFYSAGKMNYNFIAQTTLTAITLWPTADGTLTVDNVTCKLATPDRSVKNNGLILNGTLSKQPVAVGANLVAYSGFSAANYCQQPYSANQDYALAQFAFLLSLKEGVNSVAEVLLERAYYTAGAYSGPRIRCEVDAAGKLKATFSDGTNTAILTSTAAVNTAAWQVGLVIGYDGVNFRMMQNGIDIATPAARGAVGSLSNASAVLNIGLDVSVANPATNAALTMLRAGATWPSNDQLQHIFRTESALFQAGAQGTLDGTSSAITAMAYDDSTDLLQTATSWGRSAFKDLVRVESEVSTIGAITSIAAGAGVVSIASATSARIYQPSLRMRDELRRQTEAARALGKIPVPFEFDTIAFSATTAVGSPSLTAVAATAGTAYVGMGITGVGIPAGTTILSINGATYTLSAAATAAGTAVVMGQSSFSLPKGYKPWGVWAAEAKKREGATKTWTRSFDGFVETVNFGVSPGANTWVSIMAIRSN